jgi:UDP-N-acetylmuramoyl-L-alanyl-D-glutamate--2,6-diaminopimelate ligase
MTITVQLDELLAAYGGGRVLQGAGRAIDVLQVTGDSRKVEPGALFVAIQGAQFDGRRFLAAAAAKGAVAAVGIETPDELAAQGILLPPELAYVQVEDGRQALAQLSAAFYGFPSRSLVVVGVTGTDGKTTTCALIESILAEETRSAANPVGQAGVITTVGARIGGAEIDTGFHVTTPDAPEVQQFLAEMRNAGCRYAIVESTSHGLDQGRVAAVDFDIAAVTNITHEHLDYHGTREAYVQAKAKLFRALYASPPKPGAPRCAVLNADDEGSYEALRTVLAEEAARHTTAVSVRSYAMARNGQRNADVVASEIVYKADNTRFRLSWWGGSPFELMTPLIGEFNVQNVLCAATAALALGIDPAAIQRGVAAMRGVAGRMERIDRGQPFLAVIDFAHTHVSLERALVTLRPLVGKRPDGENGQLIAVFGCAGLRDRSKRRLMGQTAGRLADYTVITAEDPRTEDLDAINRAIAEGVCDTANETVFQIVPDRAQAIQTAVDMAQPGDIVAAFGKGHERSMCFGTIEYPWSDQQAMADALDRRFHVES